MKLFDQLLTSIVDSDNKKRDAQSLMMNGGIMLYVFSGYMFVEKEYILAIVTVLLGWGVIGLRELLKHHVELQLKKKQSGRTKHGE